MKNYELQVININKKKYSERENERISNLLLLLRDVFCAFLIFRKKLKTFLIMSTYILFFIYIM